MKQLKSVLLALLLISPAVMALTLDEARKQGRVGETLSGYIAPLKQDGDTLALVERINQGRRQQYDTLAQRNNLTSAEVARIAGQKLVERAAPGEYVRGINGQWLQKAP
ncbi:YdbL family protein [Erwinia amylovora]